MLFSQGNSSRSAGIVSRFRQAFARFQLLALLALGALAMIAVFQPDLFWRQAGKVLPEQAKALVEAAPAAHGQIPPWATWALFGLAGLAAWSLLGRAAAQSGAEGPIDLLGQMRPALRRARVSAQNAGFVGLAVASAVLVSIASLYTTFVGSLTFFGYQPQQVVFGLFLALGIQGVCYMASWFVAEEMATRGRSGRGDDESGDEAPSQGFFLVRHFGKVLMLVIAMAASVFFSFAAHFENVYGPKRLELANLQNARADTTQVLVNTEKAIIAERDAEAARLTGSAEWREFNGKLTAMLNLADENPAFVQQQIRARRASAEGELGKTRAELQAKRVALEAVRGEIGKLQADGRAGPGPEPSGAQARIAELTSQLERARADRTTLEQALQTERGPGNDPANVPAACRAVAERQAAARGAAAANRPGGRTVAGNGRDGPVSRCIVPLVQEAKIKVETTERELRRLTGENQDRQRVAATRAESIGQLEARKLGLEGEIATLESRERQEDGAVKTVASSTENLTAATGAEIGRRVRAERDAFLRVGSKDLFDAMVLSCGSLQELLRSGAANITSRMPQGACDTSGFASRIDRIVTLDAALKDFRAACPINDALNSLTTPMDYVKKGASCLALAKVPDRTVEEKKTVDLIAQLNHPDASNFERALGSLRRGDWLAWLAAALALAVDVIVFLSAVLGAKHDTSPLMRNAELSSNDSVADALSGFGDNTIYGDEPPDILRAKWLSQSVTPVRAENDPDKIAYRLDFAHLDDERATALKAVINSVAGFGLARPLGNDGQLYDIDHKLYLHCTRQISDYETRRARSEGPRPPSARSRGGSSNAIVKAFFDDIRRVPPGGRIDDYPLESKSAPAGFAPRAKHHG